MDKHKDFIEQNKIIFYIIFALFSTVAQCRLAKYDSLGESL